MARTPLQRYRERRAYSIEKLGGKCVRCGSTSRLELDHIKKEDKSFNITQFWSLSKEKYDIELAKCQLLCHDCHVRKSFENKDWGKGYGPTDHGSSTMYKNYGCRCDECKAAYNKVTREYRQLQRLNRILNEPD
jgi:hypothetical protein